MESQHHQTIFTLRFSIGAEISEQQNIIRSIRSTYSALK